MKKISHPHEAWDYKIWTEWVKPANQDCKISQALVRIYPFLNGKQADSLPFAATKAITYFEEKRIKGIDAIKSQQAEFAMKICLDQYFENGYYGKNKAYYSTYDFRYGPSEFSDSDTRGMHGYFYRFIAYPIIEAFRVYGINKKARVGSAYEKNGKFWFHYDELFAEKW